VAKDPLDYVHVDMQLAQERAAGVARVVEPSVLGDAGLFEERFPFLPVDMRVGRSAVRLAPDQVPVFPGGPGRGALDGLVLEVLPQHRDDLGGDGYGPFPAALRELAGVTDPAVAIGPPPSRQAGMTEAFAASVRALELPDDAALVKAMGRGELEARAREYARAEAVAPADVQAAIVSGGAARERYLDQAAAHRQAGNEELARQAEELAQILTADRAQLQVADAARLEWEEATVAKAEAANEARAELEARGPARWDEHRPGAQAAEARAVQAAEPAAEAEADQETQAETAAGVAEVDRTSSEARREAILAELGTQLDQPEAEDGTWPEAQAEMGAEVDPEALTVMASIEADLTAIDDNLDRAQAGADELTARRGREQAERDRAAIDEPVIRAETEAQAELEAAAAAANPNDHAETDDIELEI
jgi:hypothetical protein